MPPAYVEVSLSFFLFLFCRKKINAAAVRSINEWVRTSKLPHLFFIFFFFYED